MKGIKFIFFLLLSLFFLEGCVKYFDLGQEISTRKVMVNGLLIPGEPPVINVRFGHLLTDSTVFELMTDSLMINDAQVWLSDTRGNSYRLFFSDSIFLHDSLFPLAGYVNYEINIKEGRKYFLKIYVAGYDTISSYTIVPYGPIVDTFLVDSVSENEHNVRITITDSCGQKDYYWLMLYDITSNFEEASIPYYCHFNPRRRMVFSDSLFDCSTFTFNVKVYSEFSTDHNLYIYRANSDLWKYIYSFVAQYKSHYVDGLPNPFAEPVVVYSNIKNGMGILGALSKPVVIPLMNSKK